MILKIPIGSIHGMKVVDYGLRYHVANKTIADHLNVAADAQREGAFDRADEILRQALADHALIEIPIVALCPLPVRALNALDNAFMDHGPRGRNLAVLLKCTLADTRRWKNFGMVSRTLMGERMRALKINLTGQRDYSWVKPINKRFPRTDHLRVLPTFLVDPPDRLMPRDLPAVHVAMGPRGPVVQ